MSGAQASKPIGRRLAAYVGMAALACGGAALFAQATKPEPKSLAWHSEQQLALASLRAEDGWRWEEGGVMWRFAPKNEGPGGAGPRLSVSDTVTVHYAGTFVDGETFDSSYDRGQPATFPLGRLVKAWQVAIPNMAVGDTIELVAPAAMAYGPVGRGPIPGGATLRFKVELIAIGGS